MALVTLPIFMMLNCSEPFWVGEEQIEIMLSPTPGMPIMAHWPGCCLNSFWTFLSLNCIVKVFIARAPSVSWCTFLTSASNGMYGLLLIAHFPYRVENLN